MATNLAPPGGGYIANPIFNAVVPIEGPKNVFINVPFSTAAGPYGVDLGQLIRQGLMTCVQTLFVDNSAGSDSVTIQVEGTSQKLVIPPQSQAVVPAFAQKDARFTITSSGSTDVGINFLNVPLPTAVWSAT